MNRIAALLPILLLPLLSSAFYIELKGQVIEHFSSDPLKNVYVRVYADGAQRFFKKTKGNGKFKFNIERETVYTIEFHMEHMVAKMVQIDTRDIPAMTDVPFFQIELEIDLFPYIDGLDYSVFREPLGKAKYDNSLKNISWDKLYARKQKAAFNKFWWHYEKAFYARTPKREKMPKAPQNWPTPGS